MVCDLVIGNKKIIIVFVFIVLLVICILIFGHKKGDKVEKYIVSLGFKKVNNLYEKKLSGMDVDKYHFTIDQKLPAESTYLYLDLDRSLLTEVGLKYSLDLQYSFLGSYYFKDDKISYHYEVYDGIASAMVKGEYLDDTESCSCESVYLKNANDTEGNVFSLICEQAKYVCLDFSVHAKTLITNPFIVDELKK